ncbi:MAG: L,D-transpeptidase [Solirubrobacterales bacterium]
MKAPAIADIGRALRRYPAVTLLLAAVVGVALLLLLRGGDDAQSESAPGAGGLDLFGALRGLARLSPDDLVPDPPPDVRGPHFPIARVQPGEEVELRDAPGGRVIATLGDETEFDSPRTFWISEIRGDWFGVHTPEVYNGAGWIRDDRTELEVSETRFWIVADTSAQTLELRYRNKVLDRFPVTVGSPGSPTPLGDYSVTDGLAGPGVGPYYGCCVLALTGHQPNLPPNWIGGDRIAVHGTPGAVGGANSAGCLRASDPDMVSLFARVPLGTPVFIRA